VTCTQQITAADGKRRGGLSSLSFGPPLSSLAVTQNFKISDMKKKNYKRLFNLFVKDVKKIRNSSLVNIDNWTLSDDLLNGVLIGYTIFDQSDRELLHSIGRKYDLIPLCPNEFVDIEVSGDGKIFGSFVQTMFGKLYISQKSG
jgi:hypothetical protein